MEKLLTSLGLSSEEAELYLALLERGTQSAAQIASSTSIKRTYVYKVADAVAQKGLVIKEKKGRTTVFTPNSPDHLLSLVEAVKSQAETAGRELEAHLTQLKTKYSSIESKPIIQVFEGTEALKKIFKDTLKEGKTIYALVQPSATDPELQKWLRTKYVPERVKLGIKAKVLLGSGKKSKDYVSGDKISLRETLEINNDKYPFEHEVNIYGNKIAFIQDKKGEQHVGVIIDHPLIAKTMRSLFKLSWEMSVSQSK